jgi:hypothetical protein
MVVVDLLYQRKELIPCLLALIDMPGPSWESYNISVPYSFAVPLAARPGAGPATTHVTEHTPHARPVRTTMAG